MALLWKFHGNKLFDTNDRGLTGAKKHSCDDISRHRKLFITAFEKIMTKLFTSIVI